jgi:SAM-dependent methyltransferase
MTEVFDRALLIERQRRQRRSEPGILMRTAGEEIVERLALVRRSFHHALVMAPDPDPVAERLATDCGVGEVERRRLVAGDDLGLPGAAFDLVVSAFDLDTANDVPGHLVQVRRALVPDGLLLACLFAGDTLQELRQSWLAAELEVAGGVSPRVAPMIDLGELGALIQRAGFALPVVDLDRTLVRYADAIALMHEIRLEGQTSSLMGRSRRFVSKALLGAVARHYQEHFADPDGRIRTTLQVAWVAAWSPHESQPRPLPPGSARMRLADALGERETKL